MRIILYDVNQKAMSIASHLTEATESEEINVAKTVTFSIPNTAANWAQWDLAAYAAVPVADDSYNTFHLYALNNGKSNGNVFEVTGIEEAYDDLDGDGYLVDHRIKQKKLSEIANVIFDGTHWTVFTAPDLIGDQNMYYISRLEALQTMVKTFGVEIEFTYVIEKNVITERRVNIYEKMGRITNRRYVYGKNALTVEKEEVRTGIYTAYVGRGKGVEVTPSTTSADADTEPEDPAFGRRLTLADAVWSKAKGDPVDKPAGQEYVEIPEATKMWGYPDGHPRTKIITFEDDTDAQVLLQHTYDALVDVSRPQVQMSATIASLGYRAHLGDTLIIVRHDLDLVYTARIFKISRDLLNDANTTVELGDYLAPSAADRAVTGQSDLAAVLKGAQEHAQSLYSQLKAQADARQAAAEAQAEQIEKQFRDLDAQHDQDVEDFTKKVTDAQAAAEAKTSDLAATLGTYQDEVTKEFEDYNDGYDLKLSTLDGRMTEFTNTIDGFQTKVTDDVDGLTSQFKQLSDSITAKVSDDSLSALFAVQLDAITTQVKDIDGRASSLSQLVDGFQTSVTNLQDDSESKFTQLSDLISAKLSTKDFQTKFDAAAGDIQAQLISLQGDQVSMNMTVNGLTGWQTTVKNDITGLKNQMTSTINSWNEEITDSTSDLSAKITAAVTKGVSSIDLSVNSSGYLSLVGNGSTSQIWLGGSNITLTGDTHIQGDLIVDQFNKYGQVQVTPTGLHILDDYKNEDVGFIHSNNFTGHDSINGLVFDLNPLGDYMGWGYRNSTDDEFAASLAFFKNDTTAKSVGNFRKGFNFSDDVAFYGNIHPSGSTTDRLKFGTLVYNKTNYAAIMNSSGNSGVMFGASYLYLLHNGSVIPLHGLKLPTAINDDGTVKNYLIVN